MKKLLAFVVIGGLFALGCSGSPTSHPARRGGADSGSVKTSGMEVNGKGAGHVGKPDHGMPDKSGTPDKSGKPDKATAKIDFTPEPLTIAKGKDSGDLVVRVNRDGETGAITVKFEAPADVKLDKDEVVIPKDKDEAKVKVTVVKRDKGEAMIKVTVSSATAKETTKDVTVKIEK